MLCQLGQFETASTVCRRGLELGADNVYLLHVAAGALLKQGKFTDALATFYNAHTTASDALWTGLPVLTQLGETFAGRVAASLLSAIGLPELIVETEAELERLAIGLATGPSRLAAVTAKLTQHRLTQPLFDTSLYVAHLEQAYAAMFGRHRDGLRPDHIDLRY